MTDKKCSIATPPQIEDGLVSFTILHEASGEVYRCQMSSPTAVTVTAVPKGLTPWAEGDARAIVAEAAVDHVRANIDELQELFSTIPEASDEQE